MTNSLAFKIYTNYWKTQRLNQCHPGLRILVTVTLVAIIALATSWLKFIGTKFNTNTCTHINLFINPAIDQKVNLYYWIKSLISFGMYLIIIWYYGTKYKPLLITNINLLKLLHNYIHGHAGYKILNPAWMFKYGPIKTELS